MSPPLAALIAIGVIELWRFGQKYFWLAAVLLTLSADVTLAFQFFTAQSFTNNIWWMSATIALFLIGCVLLIISAFASRRGVSAIFGSVVVVAAMFITPGIWSALTNLNPNPN